MRAWRYVSCPADIDGVGLDVYVANYRTVTVRDQPNTRFTIKPDGPRVVSVMGRPLSDPEWLIASFSSSARAALSTR
jgi:hypothetical protein